MDARRDTLNRLAEAHRKVDRRLDSCKGNLPEMRRLITIRKGLRIVMEPLAASLSSSIEDTTT
jgi:hypothetical protein